jgi:hypothetical protein
MLTCPGCGRPMKPGFFLCNLCSDAVPDALIVTIGTALDEGHDIDAAFAINEAADLIREG